MIIDFRTHPSIYDTKIIKVQAVDCAESYRYLGTVIDSRLYFQKSCETVCKKGHRYVSSIIKDCSCPFHNELQSLRSCRMFVAPRWRSKRYRNSFVPAATALLNKNSMR